MKFLVINGPNLNLLGIREPDIYGKESYQALLDYIQSFAEELQITCDVFQSNHEGVLIDKIQEAMGVYDGIIINPAAYTHTSVAIADALKAVKIPAVEIHLSDIHSREDYRKRSYTSEGCIKMIAGLGFEGYKEGAKVLLDVLKQG